MIKRVMFIIGGMGLIVSCGSNKSSGGGDSQPVVVNNTSYAVAAVEDLPACTAEIENNLVYIKSIAMFQVCENGSWTEVNIKGEKGDTGSTGATGVTGATGAKGDTGDTGSAGISISEVYRYHADDYLSSTDLNQDNVAATYIGTIQLVRFSDGSAFVTTTGNTVDFDSGGSDAYGDDFTHSFFLFSNSSSAQSYIVKIQSYANVRIKYIVTLNESGTAPTFKATVDNDSDWNDTTPTSFTLTKVTSF